MSGAAGIRDWVSATRRFDAEPNVGRGAARGARLTRATARRSGVSKPLLLRAFDDEVAGPITWANCHSLSTPHSARFARGGSRSDQRRARRRCRPGGQASRVRASASRVRARCGSSRCRARGSSLGRRREPGRAAGARAVDPAVDPGRRQLARRRGRAMLRAADRASRPDRLADVSARDRPLVGLGGEGLQLRFEGRSRGTGGLTGGDALMCRSLAVREGALPTLLVDAAVARLGRAGSGVKRWLRPFRSSRRRVQCCWWRLSSDASTSTVRSRPGSWSWTGAV